MENRPEILNGRFIAVHGGFAGTVRRKPGIIQLLEGHGLLFFLLRIFQKRGNSENCVLFRLKVSGTGLSVNFTAVIHKYGCNY